MWLHPGNLTQAVRDWTDGVVISLSYLYSSLNFQSFNVYCVSLHSVSQGLHPLHRVALAFLSLPLFLCFSWERSLTWLMWVSCSQVTLSGCPLAMICTVEIDPTGAIGNEERICTDTRADWVGCVLRRRHTSSSMETVCVYLTHLNQWGGIFVYRWVSLGEQSQAVSSPEYEALIYIFFTYCRHPHMTRRKGVPLPWAWSREGFVMFMSQERWAVYTSIIRIHSRFLLPTYFTQCHYLTLWHSTCLTSVRIWVWFSSLFSLQKQSLDVSFSCVKLQLSFYRLPRELIFPLIHKVSLT